jgi:hypothetical protein
MLNSRSCGGVRHRNWGGIVVLESLHRLRESPDYEVCQLSEKKPGLLNELAEVITELEGRRRHELCNN